MFKLRQGGNFKGDNVVINNGYWNYYLSFRIHYKKYLQKLKNVDFSGIIALQENEETLINPFINCALEQRKRTVGDYREKYAKLGQEELWHLYISNELPEMYFDFNENMEDLLELSIEDSKKDIVFARNGLKTMFGETATQKIVSISLMPLKVYRSNREFDYCPIVINLFGTGNGVIKLTIPLYYLDCEELSNYPIKRWFKEVKVWEALFNKGGEESYKIVTHDDTIDDVIVIMRRYLEHVFGDCIINRDNNIGFESFVLCETSTPIISKCGTVDIDNKERLYHLAVPEDFGINITSQDIGKYWNKHHFDSNSIHFLTGKRARMIVYGDPQSIALFYNRSDIRDKNKYFLTSVNGTFDPYIFISIAKKDVELTVYTFAEHDIRSLRINMQHYYANLNYLDSIMACSPEHGSQLYVLLEQMLERLPADYRKMIERFEALDSISKNERIEKQENLIRQITLLFTCFFGLPLIYDSFSLLKTIMIPAYDVPVISVACASIMAWIIINVLMFVSYMNDK